MIPDIVMVRTLYCDLTRAELRGAGPGKNRRGEYEISAPL